MAVCPSCDHENRDGAKFCEECAMPLVKQGRTIAEERKVVTALFCDLVGFTATSEAADPEDVDRMLEIFERRQAAPALAETDALLEQATALSS